MQLWDADNKPDDTLVQEPSDSDDSTDEDYTTQTSLPSSSANIAVYYSKDRKEKWSCETIQNPQGKESQVNIMRERPGPSRFANRQVDTLESTFLLFFSETPCWKHL